MSIGLALVEDHIRTLHLQEDRLCVFLKRKKSVTLSTMEAEYMILSDATREVVHVRKLFEKIGFSFYIRDVTPIVCDNKNAITLCKENTYTKEANTLTSDSICPGKRKNKN